MRTLRSDDRGLQDVAPCRRHQDRFHIATGRRQLESPTHAVPNGISDSQKSSAGSPTDRAGDAVRHVDHVMVVVPADAEHHEIQRAQAARLQRPQRRPIVPGGVLSSSTMIVIRMAMTRRAPRASWSSSLARILRHETIQTVTLFRPVSRRTGRAASAVVLAAWAVTLGVLPRAYVRRAR
jgi:hypothetical protein